MSGTEAQLSCNFADNQSRGARGLAWEGRGTQNDTEVIVDHVGVAVLNSRADAVDTSGESRVK